MTKVNLAKENLERIAPNKEIKAIPSTINVSKEKVEAPQVKVEAAQSNEVESEKAVKVIRELIAKSPDLKIIENESKTGFSYFAGKKRLCKLLKSKRGIRLELNVKLPKKFSDLPEMDNISKDLAHRKHLGTMKHLYRSSDDKQINAIMVEAIKAFKAEMVVTEEKQVVAK